MSVVYELCIVHAWTCEDSLGHCSVPSNISDFGSTSCVPLHFRQMTNFQTDTTTTLLKARQGSNVSNMAISAEHGLSPFQGHIRSSFNYSDVNFVDLISSHSQVLTAKEWGTTKAYINTVTYSHCFQI